MNIKMRTAVLGGASTKILKITPIRKKKKKHQFRNRFFHSDEFNHIQSYNFPRPYDVYILINKSHNLCSRIKYALK